MTIHEMRCVYPGYREQEQRLELMARAPSRERIAAVIERIDIMSGQSKPVPKVGDEIYVETHLFISRGRDDFIGGLCRVKEVFEGIFAGKQVPMVAVEERPGVAMNWEFLAEEQDRLREVFGDRRGHAYPDMRPEFNKL